MMKPTLFQSLQCVLLWVTVPMAAQADLIIGGSGNLVLAEEGGDFAAGNLSLLPGATAFSNGDLGDTLALAFHQEFNLNDGVFGNANSWIGDFNQPPEPNLAPSFGGIAFGSAQDLSSVAFGRDNLGAFTDRVLGLYTLQFTQVADPGAATPVTGDPATGWADIGTLEYGAGAAGTNYLTPPLRHRYNFDQVSATGVRLLTPGGAAIDELEIYATPGEVQEPPSVVELAPQPGFSLSYDGNDGDFFDQAAPPSGAIVPANLALGGTAFGSSEFGGGGVHTIAHANDGYYGNSNSWIADFAGGDAAPMIGIALGGEFEISAIAWGRDNGNGAFDDSVAGSDACGGQCSDRSVGSYTVQITTDADPATTSDWTTVGTISYSVQVDQEPGGGFTPYFRHQFGMATEGGDPLTATGVRLLVPDSSICIDEIEVLASGMVPRLVPVESGGEIDGANNLAGSATAFAKDALGGRQIGSLNDGVPGDASAWAGATPDSFAGISLGADPVTVRSIAFGRDNTGAETDRVLGTYTLQFTTVADPDETTPDNQWETIGEIIYEAGNPADPHLRHRFNFSDVMATGIRLLSPDAAAIDELEVYSLRYTPPLPPGLIIAPAAGYAASWDGNDGDFFDPVEPPTGALVPDNLALASNGGVAFSSSDLGPELAIGYHIVDNLNDGFYGNLNSWISASADPGPQAFAGIAFAAPTAISSIAWGRDNGNGAIDDSAPGTDCCGGQADDRSAGTYTLQFTTAPSPDASTPDEGWTTIAEFVYSAADAVTDNEIGGLFTEWLRHQYEIGGDGGAPIIATGVRILVPAVGLGGGTDIDEIEVYGTVSTAPFAITAVSYLDDGAQGTVSITFNSQQGKFYLLEGSTDLDDWRELDDSIVGAGTSTTVIDASTDTGTGRRYFRIREF